MPDDADALVDETSAIVQVFLGYVNNYARDTEVAASFWGEPAIFILPSEVIVLKSRVDVTAYLAASLARLKSMGYSHTEIRAPQVKILNSTTALYSMVMDRMKTDLTVLEQAGGIYIFRKGSAGWKIIEGIATDPDKIIKATK